MSGPDPTKIAWVSRVLGVELGSRGPGAPPNLQAALTEWAAVRDRVTATLREIADEVAAAKLPETDGALIELKAVVANLAGEPSTQQRLNELRTWVEGDDVVAEVSELADDIRTPLLGALAHVGDALHAAAAG